MLRIFVYEAITGGGSVSPDGTALDNPLLAEGLAMVRAVTEDFAAIDDVEVWGLRDARLPQLNLPRQETVVRAHSQERAEFLTVAEQCDFAMVIAPELDGVLEERVAWAKSTKAGLLSPTGEFLTIAVSKRRTAKWLSLHGIPVPPAVDVPPNWAQFIESLDFPLLCKRDDGAGSVEMRMVHDARELARVLRQRDLGNVRWEQFCRGMPASVAVLCGPAGNVAVQPCEQVLNPATFEYLGGRTPLPPLHESRARSLALAAIAAMPLTKGYVGVDMILGDLADGSGDVVVEINPRLTTSYIGLRQVCRQNLAQAMLDVAQGRPVELSYTGERVEFQTDGSRLKR